MEEMLEEEMEMLEKVEKRVEQSWGSILRILSTLFFRLFSGGPELSVCERHAGCPGLASPDLSWFLWGHLSNIGESVGQLAGAVTCGEAGTGCAAGRRATGESAPPSEFCMLGPGAERGVVRGWGVHHKPRSLGMDSCTGGASNQS